MKNAMCLLALLLGLAACTPMVATSATIDVPATETPVPSPTVAPTPTETGTPTDSPTPEPSVTPARPDVTFGLAKTADEVKDLGSMDKLIEAAKYFAGQPPVVSTTQFAFFGKMEQPDVSEVDIGCYNANGLECAILATARVGDSYYLITQISTKAGPKNMLLYLGYPLAGKDAYSGRIALNRLNFYKGGFSAHIMARIKIKDYDNPEVHKLTVGPDDPLLDWFVHLCQGEIIPGLETTPVWAIIP